MKHTPGPWFYRLVENTTCGGLVANRPIDDIGGIESPGEFLAAFVSEIDGPLIAASPDLLQAASALIDALLQKDSDFAKWDTVVALSEAVRKAEGRHE